MFEVVFTASLGALASLIAAVSLALIQRFASRMRKQLSKSERTQADNTIALLRADVAELRSSFETGFSEESRDIGVDIFVNVNCSLTILK